MHKLISIRSLLHSDRILIISQSSRRNTALLWTQGRCPTTTSTEQVWFSGFVQKSIFKRCHHTGPLVAPQNLQVLLLLFTIYLEKLWHNKWLMADKMQVTDCCEGCELSEIFYSFTLRLCTVRHWNTLPKYLDLLPKWLETKKMREGGMKEASKGVVPLLRERILLPSLKVEICSIRWAPRKRAESCWVNPGDVSGQTDSG